MFETVLAQALNQPPSQNLTVTLDPMTWSWLQISFWAFAIALIAFLVALGFHIIHVWRTPLESKQIRGASHQKKAGLLLAGDDGYTDYYPAQYTGNEGWGETKETGKPKSKYIGFFPRPGKVSDAIPVESGADLAKTRSLAEYVNFLNTRKLFLRGAKTSLWIGVKPKAILANIQAIAALQLTEELALKWASVIEPISKTVFPIDVSALKRMVVSSSYNESQVVALTKIHEQIGYEKKSESERLGKWFFIIAIVMLVAGVVSLGVAAFITK